MKEVCTMCGVLFEHKNHTATLCPECTRNHSKVLGEEYRTIKEAQRRYKNNKLDAYCVECEKKGKSYAQMQVEETLRRTGGKRV